MVEDAHSFYERRLNTVLKHLRGAIQEPSITSASSIADVSASFTSVPPERRLDQIIELALSNERESVVRRLLETLSQRELELKEMQRCA